MGFHEYEMGNASNFKRGFTHDSNPKRGNAKMLNKMYIYLFMQERRHSLGPTL